MTGASVNPNESTSSHPSAQAPDPSVTNASEGRQSSTTAAASAELSRLKVRLIKALRFFPDFPQQGINFEDIFPLFADPAVHQDLIRALELLVAENFTGQKVDTVVGLDARGFLFGPALALKLGAGFAPVRKAGKLPGPVVTASYEKEYGKDTFAMQADAVKKGGNVLIIDDIVATGGSAAAAGSLVKQLGGNVLGYVFLDEIPDLNGTSKLDAPAHTLLLRLAADQ